MLRHFFSIWLVICTLGYSSAWAFDTHAEEPIQQEVSSIGVEQITDVDDQSSCDHCCHAASHMTAFWTSQSMLIFSGTHVDIWPNLFTYPSLQTEPLKGPPIS